MKNLLLTVNLLLLVSMPRASFAQAPDFGIAATFVVFTTTGAITSTAGVALVGNLGRETAGAISGFNSTDVNGKIYVDVENVTTKSSRDLNTVYNSINNIPDGSTSLHSITFGAGETIHPGTIRIGTAAANANGNITFDALGDSNSVFIIQMRGAFVTAAGFTCILQGNARSRNIIWVVEGAITFGAGNTLRGSFLALAGAVVVGADCTLEGRLTSTTGAMTLANLRANIAPGLFKNYFDGTVYKGSDWFDTNNWTIDVPDANSIIYIPKNADAKSYYPVISSSTVSRSVSISALTIEGGAVLTVTNNGSSNLTGKLSISGAIIDSFGIDASSGTIEFNGTSNTPQIMPAKLFVNNNVQNLILSNNVNVTGLQNITGSLSFTGNNRTVNTGGFLVLKSSANGTAQLADITNGGTISGNTIVGNVSIERYLTPRRAWRLLSVPIGAAGAPTINAAWQEGATTDALIPNPNPGFGTFITGANTDNGYDIGVNHHPSLKVYDNASNTISGLPIGNGSGVGNGTYVPITNYQAYFIFVRGDRSALLLQGIYTVPTNTILRISGSINTNDQTIPVNVANFTLISNPYPAAINFASITKNNVADNFYVWNPQLSTIGGYITVSNVGGNYVSVPSSTHSSQYIASGDAFFVQSADGINPSKIIIKETDKNNSGSDDVFRPMTTTGTMRVNLSGINADSSATLVDGIFTSFADNNSNSVNKDYVKKMTNINENICLGRENQLFSIEQRQTIKSNDTSFIKLYMLNQQRYQFVISAGNMDSNAIRAVLKDSYDININNTIIKLDGSVNNINFTVNADSGSFAINRFSIVYENKLLDMPLKFANIEVSGQQKNALLTWKMANEANAKEYIIETGTTISTFKYSATVLPAFNISVSANYTWLDLNVAPGIHYYRVKAVDISGKITYSSIVKIDMENDGTPGAIIAVPNLIIDNKVNFKLNNITAGTYSLQLLNMQGQFIKTVTVQHDGLNNTLHTFNAGASLANGKYLLQLNGNPSKFSTSIIKE